MVKMWGFYSALIWLLHIQIPRRPINFEATRSLLDGKLNDNLVNSSSPCYGTALAQ
jgi:hypothetical protein